LKAKTKPDDLLKHYNPSEAEEKWYTYWEKQGFFHSEPDEREPYTIVIPPPNVTGVLHMGHMLNNTIQDVLVRRARLLGKNACWIPGTDHASIATEAKVVQKLRKQGITKGDLTRDKFLEHAWKWTEEHGGIILQQLRKLGASCDWQRTRFTLEDELYDSVIDCFIELYERGYIYRGKRMINWDPEAKTALSDEEVIHKEVQSKLYHIGYRLKDSNEHIIIATTRPETILADTALCVHPEDERYQHLIGKKALIPLINREIVIIADDYVDPEYGSGCLKITPAHDPNDYEIGLRHDLEIIDMLNEDGSLNANAQLFAGKDRFEARELIAKELREKEHLVKVEELSNKVGFSERTDAVIEPRLSLQWFCRMEELAKPALQHVMSDDITFHPSKFKNSYKHWMDNIRDWCISRQLWWGQRIPAWYYGQNKEDYVIAKTREEAIEKARQKSDDNSITASDLQQDEDVLDTWFSSWLWPITVFDGFKDPDNEDINYYYPTNDLVTAPEIMFFWVARMIMSGFEFRGEKPFSNVYFTGIVRDAQRRKMSKSLGNSPDPLKLIDTYGADGVRVGMLFSSPAGNDLLFEESLCEQGRNFANKIWNAFRFLAMNMEEGVNYRPPQAEPADLEDRWILSRIHATIKDVNQQFASFRLNDALRKIYALIWDDFCDWYIEVIKPAEPDQSIPREKLARTLQLFEILLKLLHPFMPFITEEIWQQMARRDDTEALIISTWPEIDETLIDTKSEKAFILIQQLISNMRNIRAEMNISPNTAIDVRIKTPDTKTTDLLKTNVALFNKLQSIEHITIGTEVEKPEASTSAVVSGCELYIPLEGLIDIKKEKKRLQNEIRRLEGFLETIDNKLSNNQFIEKAPHEIVQRERDKKEDTEISLKKLKEILSDL